MFSWNNVHINLTKTRKIYDHVSQTEREKEKVKKIKQKHIFTS